jgi:hypothetical protein
MRKYLREKLMRKHLMIVMIVAFLGTAFVVPFQTTAAQSDWATFWQKFKTAVVSGDKQTVLSLSKSSQMPADYRSLFGTRARKQCFAKAKPVKDEQGAYSVFCGEQGYLFSKVDGQFKFTEAFAND